MNGYGGSVLRVNLSTGKIKKEPLDSQMAKNYFGGRGFASYVLYKEVPAGIDPLGDENKLLLISGPLTGMFVPGGGKATFASKSPATGSYGDSNVGGMIGAEMKYAGYDLIIFEGKAPKPTYLFIDDDKVELRSAEPHWGKGAITCEKDLKEELSEDFQIATIGPAGERLIPIACIHHDWGRQAGRTGVGAVMGSKNLKAIAVHGTKSVPVADLKSYRKAYNKMFKFLRESPARKVWVDYGTPGVVEWANEIGAFPTRNFSSGFLKSWEKVSGPTMRKEIVITDKCCFACPTACGKYSHVKTKGREFYVEGPEYETIAMIGSDNGLDDIRDIAYANYLCDEMGLDTISAGNIAAFAIECFNKGIITEKDTGGASLKFGDPESVFHLIELMGKQEKIGELLSQGVKYASEKLGQGSEKFACHVKGLEISGYEFHRAPAMALAYMTADIGAHHNRAWAITYDIEVGRDKIEGKAERVILLQHIRPLFDIMGACRLQWVEVGLSLETYPPLFNAITGFDLSWEEMLKTAERVWNLTRCFWVREVPDFGRSWDKPPARFLEDPVTDGPTKGAKMSPEDVEQLLDDYYRLRCWNSNGIPTKDKLKELGLEWVVADLKKRGRL